jgi:membrane fusion protein (multidrug efflux system)
MGVLDTEEGELRAAAKAKRAAFDLAKIELGYTSITAPIDGMVSERGMRAGQYVHDGTQVISVVPLQNVWVVANYRETHLTPVKIGQRAEITINTFSGHRGHGACRQRFPGQRLAIHPAAARQRHRQFYQGRAAHP